MANPTLPLPVAMASRNGNPAIKGEGIRKKSNYSPALLIFDRIPGIRPFVKTSEQSRCLAKTFIQEYLRGTRAGVFLRSRAVGDDLDFRVELGAFRFHVVKTHSYGAFYLYLAFF